MTTETTSTVVATAIAEGDLPAELPADAAADTTALPEATGADAAAPEPALTPEAYDFTPATPDAGYDPALAGWFRETAHAVGMPVEMARALHDRFVAQRAAEGESLWQRLEERRVGDVRALRRDWGATFDVNLALARRAVDELGGEALRAALEETGVGDHPALVRAFARTGQRLFGSAGGGAGEARTAIAAQREILRLRSDERFMSAYADRGHPNHVTAQAQMDELYTRAYPAGKQGGAA